MNRAVEHRAPVLVDTNVIIESYRTGAWGALAGGYRVETVEDCVIETQTGFQRRRAEELIGVRELRASLEAEHAVDVRGARGTGGADSGNFAGQGGRIALGSCARTE